MFIITQGYGGSEYVTQGYGPAEPPIPQGGGLVAPGRRRRFGLFRHLLWGKREYLPRAPIEPVSTQASAPASPVAIKPLRYHPPEPISINTLLEQARLEAERADAAIEEEEEELLLGLLEGKLE